MTDEALRWDNAGGTGNLSNVPLHMADLGTDNYDQEFTLGLIENEQGTLELVNEALDRMEQGNVRAMRGVRRADLQAAAPGDPLCPALHRLCTEAGGRRMKAEGGVGSGPAVALLVDRPGRDRVRSGDQVDRLCSRVGPPASPIRPGRPAHPRAAHQPEHGRPLGLRGEPARQQPDLRRPLGRRRGRDLLLPLRPGSGLAAGC